MAELKGIQNHAQYHGMLTQGQYSGSKVESSYHLRLAPEQEPLGAVSLPAVDGTPGHKFESMKVSRVNSDSGVRVVPSCFCGSLPPPFCSS